MRVTVCLVLLVATVGCGDRTPGPEAARSGVEAGKPIRARVDSGTAARLGHFTPGSPMAEIARRFVASGPPRLADLVDVRWVEIQTVRTQHFMTGADGPDDVRTDSSGLRAGNDSYEWVVDFRLESSGRLRVIQREERQPARSDAFATYSPDSTLSFSLDNGADETIRTWCRAPRRDELLCLDLEHLGDAMVLRPSIAGRQ